MKIYNSPVQVLNGPAAVLAACDHHPLARFGLSLLADPSGLAHDGAILFSGRNREGRETGFYVGPADDQLPDGDLAGGELSGADRSGGYRSGGDRSGGDLLDQARGAGVLDRLDFIHLPRGGRVPAGFRVRDDWDFRWATHAPPGQPGQEAVVALPSSAGDGVDALLDLAMPESTVRPGHPSARQWYGILDGGVLVACGADRSGHLPSPAPVGVVGGIAVHPACRGRGYGAAVSATVTTRLFDQYDVVTLGVYPDNCAANRIYERLGYTGRWAITSVRPEV